MHSSLLLPSILLASTITPSTNAQASPFDAVSDAKQRAEFGLSTLQIWYNAGTGVWDTAGWWNSANIMTMVGNLAKADPDNAMLQDLVSRIYANTLIQGPSKNPQPNIESKVAAIRENVATTSKSNGKAADLKFTLFNETGFESGYAKRFDPDTNETLTTYPDNWDAPGGAYKDISELPIYVSVGGGGSSKSADTQIALKAASNVDDWLDGFYDDDLWWALAWINAYDVTSNTAYLRLAEGIFRAVSSAAWPTRCNDGGIYWNFQHEYIAAIANELFFSTAAHLANRVSPDGKAEYVDWAQRTLDWFMLSGMINSDANINDGLTDDCKNNGRNEWSYNQGVILGGLVELNRAAPDASLMKLASDIATAAIDLLGDENGVLHDTCEPNCGGDGTQFKGIFMRNLMVLHQAAPQNLFADFIKSNAESIWANDRDGDAGNVFSVNWAGPFIAPANASTHSSAMDALVAAMIVR